MKLEEGGGGIGSEKNSQFKISQGFENGPAACILLSLIPSWFKVYLVVISLIVSSNYILFN
jgi:hypothetical protein